MGVLSKFIISVSGDVGPRPEQLKKWVENNGGKWVLRPTKGITHLICSKEHWKAENDAVQTALQAGAHVVSYDWLEDSLQRRRKLAEKKYTWKEIRKERKKRKQFVRLGKKADTMNFNKGCAQALEDTRSGTSSSLSIPGASSRASGGFFASALEDLKKRREEREATEVAGRAQKGAHVATATAESAASSQPKTVTGQVSTPAQNPLKRSSSAAQKPVPQQLKARLPIPAPPVASVSQSRGRPSTRTSTPKDKPAEKLTDNYHVYLDSTGFEYSLKLLRTNLYQNTFAQYQIRLYESHTKPHVYCTFIRYLPSVKDVEAVVSISAEGTAGGEAADEEPQPVNPRMSHPNLLRAMSLIQPPPPPTTSTPASAPYRALLSPPNSSYMDAFTTFRLAFETLTFLAWEERLDTPDRDLQKLRAVEKGLEPFAYKKPEPGLPMGDMPALPIKFNLAVGGENGTQLKLPAMDVKLAKDSGTIGSSLYRAAEDARKRAEKKQQEKEEKEKEAKRQQRAVERVKNSNYYSNPNRALFNGVKGRPERDYQIVKNEKGGSYGVMGGLANRRWPSNDWD